MVKTPVSILQEYCARRIITPQYDLVINEIGTHNPHFQYKLTVAEIITHGSGKSKKEAKHEAALKAVQILYPDSKEAESVEVSVHNDHSEEQCEEFFSPYQNVIKENSIGDLATICGNKSLPDPKYVYVGEVGMPHAKTFTFECHVANLKEQASSRTKQQAKHLSAIQMIKRLQSVVGDSILETSIINDDAIDKMSTEARAIYKQTKTKLSNTFNMYITDYHEFDILNFFDGNLMLDDLCNYNSSPNENPDESPRELLLKLFKESNKEVEFLSGRSESKNLFFSSCGFESQPIFVTLEIGESKEIAEIKAAHSMLLMLKSLLLSTKTEKADNP